jgi:hypothetical protein
MPCLLTVHIPVHAAVHVPEAEEVTSTMTTQRRNQKA